HTRSDRDWSSDVCSSDLAMCWLLRQLDAGKRIPCSLIGIGRSARVLLPAGSRQLVERSVFRSRQVVATANTWPQFPAHRAGGLKIGRASCRERGEKAEVG